MLEYNCDNPKAGIALIFNHETFKKNESRIGTDIDRDHIKKTLDNYGFDVRVYDDSTFEEIKEILERSK